MRLFVLVLIFAVLAGLTPERSGFFHESSPSSVQTTVLPALPFSSGIKHPEIVDNPGLRPALGVAIAEADRLLSLISPRGNGQTPFGARPRFLSLRILLI